MGRYREAKEQLTGFFGGLGGDRTVYGPKDECQKKLNKYKKIVLLFHMDRLFFGNTLFIEILSVTDSW